MRSQTRSPTSPLREPFSLSDASLLKVSSSLGLATNYQSINTMFSCERSKLRATPGLFPFHLYPLFLCMAFCILFISQADTIEETLGHQLAVGSRARMLLIISGLSVFIYKPELLISLPGSTFSQSQFPCPVGESGILWVINYNL